jgi:hypothetical protein
MFTSVYSKFKNWGNFTCCGQDRCHQQSSLLAANNQTAVGCNRASVKEGSTQPDKQAF